jgi:hypothetical protein
VGKVSLLAITSLVVSGLIAGAAGSSMQLSIFAPKGRPQSAGSFQLAAVYCQTKSWSSMECIYFKKMYCHNFRGHDCKVHRNCVYTSKPPKPC